MQQQCCLTLRFFLLEIEFNEHALGFPFLLKKTLLDILNRFLYFSFLIQILFFLAIHLHVFGCYRIKFQSLSIQM